MTRKCGGQVWAVLSKPVSWLSSCVSGFSLHLLRVLEYLSFSHSALSPSSAGFLTQAHLSVHLALTHYFLWPCCLHLLWPSSPLPQPNSSFLAPHLLIWTWLNPLWRTKANGTAWEECGESVGLSFLHSWEPSCQLSAHVGEVCVCVCGVVWYGAVRGWGVSGEEKRAQPSWTPSFALGMLVYFWYPGVVFLLFVLHVS